MMTPYQRVLIEANLKGASQKEIDDIIEYWGKSCKTCDYWQELTESTGRCKYFEYLYQTNPELTDYQEPEQQPITSNTGLCEVFSGYREGDL